MKSSGASSRPKDDSRVTIISSQVLPIQSLAALETAHGQSLRPKTDRRPSTTPKVYQSVTDVGLDLFSKNIDSATAALSHVFTSAFEKTFGDFQLNEVEVNLEISADGKVGFLGSGVGVKGSSSFTLRFTRKGSSKAG
jgi:hypothetical protein